jgi:hypothetical protein
MNKKIVAFVVLALFLINLPVFAITENISGKLEQEVIYNNETEEWQGKSLMELEYDQSFGFDKSIYLNTDIYTNYENEAFTDLKIDLDEAYFDLYLTNTDLRVGQQLINWGSAYEINPSSMTNPYDLTALNPTEEKLGVPAVKSKYYFNNTTSLTGVVITDFIESPVPASLQKMMVGDIKANFAQQIGSPYGEMIVSQNLQVKESKPEIDELSELEYAVNFMKRDVRGFDLSASYFNGYEDLPSITSDLDEVSQDLEDIAIDYQRQGSSSDIAELDVGYKRTQGIGLNAIGSIGSVGVWSEFNYQINEDDEKTIDVVLGSDYTFENNLYTVAQIIHRDYQDYQIERGEMNYLLLHGDKPFRQIHQIKANVIYDLGIGNYMFNPEMTFSLSNNLDLDLGTVLTGDSENSESYSTFNMMSGERSYFELTYSF